MRPPVTLPPPFCTHQVQAGGHAWACVREDHAPNTATASNTQAYRRRRGTAQPSDRHWLRPAAAGDCGWCGRGPSPEEGPVLAWPTAGDLHLGCWRTIAGGLA